MVQTRLIVALMASSVLVSCAHSAHQMKGERFSYDWHAVGMDASRTGVGAVVGDSIDDALGTVSEDGTYTSPSGREFAPASAAALSARALISYQDTMAPLRTVIGHSTVEMNRGGVNCAIYSWTADALKAGVETLMGCEVDAAVMNKGGIRIDMPSGDVTVNDITSMFPFKNYLCYVEMPGYEVRRLLEFFASGKYQAVSGIDMTVSDGKVVAAKVGGRELDDKSWYRMASVDYLLDGGDHIYLARNARKVIVSDYLMLDWMKVYVDSLTASGKNIECSDYQRVEVL